MTGVPRRPSPQRDDDESAAGEQRVVDGDADETDGLALLPAGVNEVRAAG
jgi:hypothetical protein